MDQLTQHNASSRRCSQLGNSPTGTPPIYSCVVYHSVDQIDMDAWTTLAGDEDPFMDPGLLRAVEVSMAADGIFRYVMFRDATGCPAAIACLCTYSVDSAVLAEGAVVRQIAEALKRVSSSLTTYRITFVGLPFSGGQSHLRFAAGVDSKVILRQMNRIATDVAKQDRASFVVFKEFTAPELSSVDVLKCFGYLRADSLPMNEVRVVHDSFESFLQSLRSHKRRKILKSLRKFSEGGLRLIRTTDAAEIDRWFSDDVYRMYQSVVDRSDTRLEVLPAEFFRHMVQQLRGVCELCFIVEGDATLGFVLCLVSKDWYYPLFAGVDYRRNREFDLYFNLMYAAVADAMARGCRTVMLGQNADHCKLIKFGGYQTSRTIFIKGVSRPMHLLLRLFSRWFLPARPMFGLPADPAC